MQRQLLVCVDFVERRPNHGELLLCSHDRLVADAFKIFQRMVAHRLLLVEDARELQTAQRERERERERERTDKKETKERERERDTYTKENKREGKMSTR